jgi:hypothetical protein
MQRTHLLTPSAMFHRNISIRARRFILFHIDMRHGGRYRITFGSNYSNASVFHLDYTTQDQDISNISQTVMMKHWLGMPARPYHRLELLSHPGLSLMRGCHGLESWAIKVRENHTSDDKN